MARIARCCDRAPNSSISCATDLPSVGDQFGGDALRHQATLVGVPRSDPRSERIAVLAVGHRRAHRNPRHHLDTAGDHDVVGAGDHALGGEVRGLLAGSALPVDRGAGHVLGPAGGEHGVAGHVRRLLTDLHDTAEHDVVDDRRVDPVAILQRRQRLGGEIDRMPVLQLAVAFPQRGAHGVDDDGSGHWPESGPEVCRSSQPEPTARSITPCQVVRSDLRSEPGRTSAAATTTWWRSESRSVDR